ncbi:MAG: ABC transporter permease [Chloroflexi bacterium]|nr:ABC transporter permease [Chloroflexota bacterium]
MSGPLAAVARRVRQYAPPVLFLAALVAAWELGVHLFDVQPYVLPSPGRIWSAFVDVRSALPEHIRATMTQAIAGLGIACVMGVVVAGVLAASGVLRRMIYPLLVISQNIPVVVLAPIIVLWFGFGMMPKAGLVALITFFPIVVATTDGLLRAERDLVDLARSFGAGRFQVMRTILIPSAIPGFFAGLQISATYAVLGSVISEWVGARAGLGLFIVRSQTAFRLDQVFVAVVVIATVSILLFALVHLLARIVMPWQHTYGEPTEGRS